MYLETQSVKQLSIQIRKINQLVMYLCVRGKRTYITCARSSCRHSFRTLLWMVYSFPHMYQQSFHFLLDIKVITL